MAQFRAEEAKHMEKGLAGRGGKDTILPETRLGTRFWGLGEVCGLGQGSEVAKMWRYGST